MRTLVTQPCVGPCPLCCGGKCDFVWLITADGDLDDTHLSQDEVERLGFGVNWRWGPDNAEAPWTETARTTYP